MKKKWTHLVYAKCKKLIRVMTLNALIILLALGHISASVYSQETKLSLNLNDVSIEKVLTEIKKKTEFNFLYRSDLFQDAPLVSVSVDMVEIEIILDLVVVPNGFSYEIEDKTAVFHMAPLTPVSKKEVQQPREIKGVVSDENGYPLPGVSVLVKGTQVGVTTNIDGSYSLQIPDDAKIIIFSFLGMETQEIAVGDQTSINVMLISSSFGLDDVVVTALGISREKKALGYAVGEVNSEDLNLVPQENVLGGLSSKISGLDIRRGGNDLNGETFVYIRGRTSLTGNDEPLVIIDGVPVGSTSVLSDISSMNIESVSVLKGASAAALYGSRAGNGVILVTTKTGAGMEKGIGVSFNTSTTFNTPYKYRELQNRFTNGQKGLFNESTWQHWYGAEEGTSVVQWNTDGVAEPLKFYQNSLQDYFETGVSTINDISVSGNYDKGNYRFTVSQMSGNGFTPATELQKIGFSLATSYKITDKLTLSTNMDVSNPKSDNYPLVVEGGDVEYFDIYNIAPHININDLKGDYWEVKNVQQRRVGEGYNNPWFSTNERQNKFDKIRGFGNAKLDWEISPALTAMVRVSFSGTNNKAETLKPWSFDGFGGGTAKPTGAYNLSYTNERESNTDFLVTYDKKISDFQITSSVGGNIRNNSTSMIASGGDNLVLPGLFTLSNVDRGGLKYNSGFYEKAVYSLYGMSTMSYKNMVYLDLSARNDWSSTLPEENYSYFYPSASLSLLFSEMIEMPDWVSLVKLRSGWAEVGKDTNPYLINPTLSQGYWGSNFTYSLPGSMPNTTLKPEIARSYEIGTDIAFLKGRIGFEATYYTTQNRNQILNVAITPMSGYTSTTINAGNVENTGIELGLNLTPVKTKDLVWNVNMNFTKQQSKLLELVDGIDMVSFGGGRDMGAFTRVGGIIGDLYSPFVKKVEEGEYKGWNLLDANGRWEVERDQTKQYKIGKFTNDFAMGFNTSVTYKSFTLSASFDWRQGGNFFSESMKRMARSGKIESWENGISTSTFSGALGANDFNGDLDALANEIETNPIYRDNNVWIGGRNEELGGFEFNGNYNGAFFPGVIDNGDGTYTENFGAAGTKYFDAYRVVESSGSFWRTGSTFMYDASFVKMRDITLTYKLPAKIAGLIRAQDATVSVYAKNLLLWTAADIGIDPELSYNRGQQGFEKWNMAPWTVPIGFRLNLNF